MTDSFPLEWILLVIVVGIFLASCVWRMSHVDKKARSAKWAAPPIFASGAGQEFRLF